MDKKKSFLDVLVQAVFEKFPDLLETSETLNLVTEAERSKYIIFLNSDWMLLAPN